MPEIIDQANELEELQREAAIAKCASTMRRYQLLTAATAGKRYPSGAGNWWRVASAALTVRKNLKNVASTRGDACRQ